MYDLMIYSLKVGVCLAVFFCVCFAALVLVSFSGFPVTFCRLARLPAFCRFFP